MVKATQRCETGCEHGSWVVPHLPFICELCELQAHRGQYFLHTHPHSADSWDQPPVVDFMRSFPDTFQTVTDRCMMGSEVPLQGKQDVHSAKTTTSSLMDSKEADAQIHPPYGTIMKAVPTALAVKLVWSVWQQNGSNITHSNRSLTFSQFTQTKASRKGDTKFHSLVSSPCLIRSKSKYT